MSRCRQTDALLDTGFAGTGLTREQADHAARCSECARALAQARRFDGELHRVGAELSPEPVPSAVLSVMGPGGTGMSRHRHLVALAGVAVVLVAVIFGGGQWLGSALGGRLDVGGWFGSIPAGSANEGARREAAERAADQVLVEIERREEAEFQAWFAPVLVRTFETTLIDEVEIFLADRCDGLYAVTFTEADDPGMFKWVAGQGDHTEGSAQGGNADSMDGSGIAAARGTVDAECTRVVDAAPHGAIMQAVVRGAGVPEGVTLLGSALLTPDLSITAVEGAVPFGERQRWIGLVRQNRDGWLADPSDWIGINIPANDGLTAYELDMLDPSLRGRFIVGAVPPGAHSIELIVDGTVYRYSVGAEPGVVILAPDSFMETADFRILSSDSSVVLEGSIR